MKKKVWLVRSWNWMTTLLAPVYDLHTATSLGLLRQDNKCKVLGTRVVMLQDNDSSELEAM